MQALNEMKRLEWLAIPSQLELKPLPPTIQQKEKQDIEIKENKRKCRAAKKRQKIQQRLKAYQTPQAKKERRRITKEKAKAKQREQVKGMTKQQIGQLLTKKRQQKQLLKQKMLLAKQTGLSILVDCAYQEQMNVKQRRSLGIQIQLIYKAMRHVDNPCSLNLCSVNGDIAQCLKKMGLINLPISINSDNIIQVGKKLNKQLIYLSPDAPQELKQVSNQYAYIIGGLVDRTILKNASLNRAQELGIKSYCLPIKQYMIKRKCLNLDQVALMLVKAQATKDWKQAFYSAAPKRYSKQQQIEQSSESNSQNEQQKLSKIQQQNLANSK